MTVFELLELAAYRAAGKPGYIDADSRSALRALAKEVANIGFEHNAPPVERKDWGKVAEPCDRKELEEKHYG